MVEIASHETQVGTETEGTRRPPPKATETAFRSDATPHLVPVGVVSVMALSALPVPWSGTH